MRKIFLIGCVTLFAVAMPLMASGQTPTAEQNAKAAAAAQNPDEGSCVSPSQANSSRCKVCDHNSNPQKCQPSD
jgi:hypothetical protein